MMKKYIFLIIFSISSLFILGCARTNTGQSLGEHNLSKGKCKNIKSCKNGKCKDESVQYVCEMIGGEFQPREIKDKNKWIIF